MTAFVELQPGRGVLGVAWSPGAVGWARFAATVVLSVTLCSAAISGIFFTAGLYVEHTVLHEQSRYIGRTLANDMRVFVPPGTKMAMPAAPADGEAADAAARANNAAVWWVAVVFMGVLVGMGLLIALALCALFGVWGACLPVLVVVTAVALTELLFLMAYGSKFIFADPNVVRNAFVVELRDALAAGPPAAPATAA